MTLQQIGEYNKLLLERQLLLKEIKELRASTRVVSDVVQASRRRHPFTEHRVHVEGAEKADTVLKRIGKKEARVRRIERQLAEIERFVDDIGDPIVRACLQKHYVEDMTWPETARAVYGTQGNESTARMTVKRYFEARGDFGGFGG